MAHATVRTIEIGRLSDHAEHGFMPKDRTISTAAAGLWVATHNPARTIMLLKNVTSVVSLNNQDTKAGFREEEEFQIVSNQ